VHPSYGGRLHAELSSHLGAVKAGYGRKSAIRLANDSVNIAPNSSHYIAKCGEALCLA
jgi:hypothetical protein